MPCRFCSVRVSDATTCSDCEQLIKHRFWGLLAHRWVTCRPEDWIPDVAAFLEVSEGLREPTRVEPMVVP